MPHKSRLWPDEAGSGSTSSFIAARRSSQPDISARVLPAGSLSLSGGRLPADAIGNEFLAVPSFLVSNAARTGRRGGRCGTGRSFWRPGEAAGSCFRRVSGGELPSAVYALAAAWRPVEAVARGFSDDLPTPEPAPPRRQHPWGPPGAEFSGNVPLDTLLLGRTD